MAYITVNDIAYQALIESAPLDTTHLKITNGLSDGTKDFNMNDGTLSSLFVTTVDLGTNTITDGNLTGTWAGVVNLTASGSIYIGGTNGYYINTADGSDSSWLAIAAANSYGPTRAGTIYMYGNEYATDALKGSIILAPALGDNSANFGNVIIRNSNTDNVIVIGDRSAAANKDVAFAGGLSGITTLAGTGAISGFTTLGLSGAITGATATNTINGIIINSGAVSGVSTLAGTGAITGFTTINMTQGAHFNSGSTDVDFQVESNTLTHAFFVQGSNGYVGINSSAPGSNLVVVDAALAEIIVNKTSGKVCALGVGGDGCYLGYDSAGYLDFAKVTGVRAAGYDGVMRLHASGGLSLGNTTDPGDTNLSVTGNLFTVVWSDYFSTSSKGGWAATPTGAINYKKIGKLVFVSFYITGTSDGVTASFTLPYTSAYTTSNFGGAMDSLTNNGSLSATAGRFVLAANNDTVNCYTNMATASWVDSGTKAVGGIFWYETA